MENQQFISNIKFKVLERQSNIERLINNNDFVKILLSLNNKVVECFDNGNKLIFCGNGGSAADCQHNVVEFIVKLSKSRKSLNDIDFNTIFIRQLEGIAGPGDILIGISTSGNSQNIVSAFEYAKQNGLYTVSVTGDSNNKLINFADTSIIIPSQNTQIIQEVYLMLFHILWERLDEVYE